ncbi:MAG: Uma2 family endonuclease [Rhodopirellula sp.]|nr:Uma2 family endonuclease [Rhodopirellula sp.]
MMSSVIQVSQVYYPESDGKPMGETDEHRDEMVRHIQTLQGHYQGQKVYVSGDLLVYYEQGNPRKFVVPDAFVVKGVSPKRRRTYKIWLEGKAPDVVIETTSRKTRRKDTVDKPALYAKLGVKEYFLFDPDREYLDPPLQGYRRVSDVFVPIAADSDRRLASHELNLSLGVEEDQVRFCRLDTGERLLAPAERAVVEAERADREAQARLVLEAELARLRAELERRSSDTD